MVVSDVTIRDVLLSAFAARFPGAAGDDAAADVLVTDDSALRGSEGALVIRPGDREFPFPLRLGALLDRIAQHLARSALQKVTIGPWTLLPAENRLLPHDGRKADDIRLTEKECAILLILRGGRTIRRQEMLDAIWGYAGGVETHTLETHIYRLRQKIEDDPANPRYLLTDETGYRLSV